MVHRVGVRNYRKTSKLQKIKSSKKRMTIWMILTDRMFIHNSKKTSRNRTSSTIIRTCSSTNSICLRRKKPCSKTSTSRSRSSCKTKWTSSSRNSSQAHTTKSTTMTPSTCLISSSSSRSTWAEMIDINRSKFVHSGNHKRICCPTPIVTVGSIRINSRISSTWNICRKYRLYHRCSTRFTRIKRSRDRSSCCS